MAEQVPASVTSMAEALRAEIAAALSAQIDFLKWKLILVAALGGTALGFLKADLRVPYILVLVPWVCLYCDLCYWHLHLRIARNSNYLQKAPDFQDTAWQAYERYSADLHTKARAYTFETFAVLVSTGFCCASVALLAWPELHRALGLADARSVPFLVSGVAGLCALIGLRWRHGTRKRSIAKLEPVQSRSVR
jgi:hypothetical protein